jgi:hypothetical protein
LVLLGVLLAIKTVRAVATFAAALVGSPAAIGRPDFFNAAGVDFLLDSVEA